MNTSLKMFLTLIVAFALGYFTYPLINNSNEQATLDIIEANSTETPQSNMDLASDNSIGKDENQSTNTSGQIAKQSVLELQSAQQTEDENKSSAQVVEVATSENVEQRDELRRWVVEHKQELGNLIETHFPRDIVNHFQEQLEAKSTAVNEPEIKQDEQKDENWAYIMEQDIRAIYEQQNGINGVELIKVTCKQLTCDMLGTAQEVGVWFKAYSALFTLPNVLLPENSPKPVHLSFPKDDVTYSYSQIFFAEQG